MNRLLELEVFSPARIVTPETFFADVETVGRGILGKAFASQFRYSGGETGSSIESGLQIYDTGKINYYYASRVAPYYGLGALEIAKYASLLFAERRMEDTIGGIDLVQQMRDASRAISSDEEFCEEFHYIDKVKSAKHPDLAVLVLKQLTSDNRLTQMGRVATEAIDSQQLDMFSKPDAKKLQDVHRIEGGIPFARIKREGISNKKIDEAIKELTDNALSKNVHVVIGPIDHSAD